ncbi:methyl-accepting chemotaxis protein, partial [Allorhizobium sp. BGMRC 0089]|nr:methyl-accepting chemotaxis protein [Allorhizobium sonneratiae]
MSATSEELAAQAEELQASIAFFKVENNAAQKTGAKRGDWKKGQHESTAPVRGKSSAQRKPSNGQTVLAQQARAKGFALDMAMGGPDDEDHHFRESA